MISKQYSQDPLLYLRKQCIGDAGAYRCVTSGFPLFSTHFGYLTTQFGYWPGRESKAVVILRNLKIFSRTKTKLPSNLARKRCGCWTSVDATHSFVQIVTRGRSPKLHNLSQGPGVRNSHVTRFDLARGSSNVASGSLSASARATYHAS